MAFRDADPDKLNEMHRAGTTPPLLALQNEQDSVLKEILIVLILKPAATAYLDDTRGDALPTRRSPVTSPTIVYVAGEYCVVYPDGKLRSGFGPGVCGAVGCVMRVMESGNAYDYIMGTRKTYNTPDPETEYYTRTVFSQCDSTL